MKRIFSEWVVGCFALLLAGCIPVGSNASNYPQENAKVPVGLPAPSIASVPILGLKSEASARMCREWLSNSGSNYVPLDDSKTSQGCSLTNAVRLRSIGGDKGTISVSNVRAVSCSTAATTVGWVRYGVDRAARQFLGAGVEHIETYGSYSCRVVAGTEVLSAHATGQAIDVSGFVLTDGRRVSVKQAWHEGSVSEKRFLRAIHQSACRRFNVILSPDYDDAHKDHFHLELGKGALCR